jgi:hypothetical protein
MPQFEATYNWKEVSGLEVFQFYAPSAIKAFVRSREIESNSKDGKKLIKLSKIIFEVV